MSDLSKLPSDSTSNRQKVFTKLGKTLAEQIREIQNSETSAVFHWMNGVFASSTNMEIGGREGKWYILSLEIIFMSINQMHLELFLFCSNSLIEH